MSSLQQWLAAQVRQMVDGGRATRSERRHTGDELSRRLSEAVGQAEADRQRSLYGSGAPVRQGESEGGSE